MQTPELSLKRVLHMNSGNGRNSYAANSSYQRNVMMTTRLILEESVSKTYNKITLSSDPFVVADLGCASGPNSLETASVVIEAITGLCRQIGNSPPEILVFLNDLPGNDFNSVAKALPAFYERLKNEDEEKKKNKLDIIGSKCFVCTMPGSFYGRLFPTRSLHFVHSSYSIHWLSQVPNGLQQNKGSICVDSTSPTSVWQLYLKQFQRDFTSFLCYRAQEIIPHGQMVLTLVGKATLDPRDKASCFVWEMLSKGLLDMADEGLVEEVDIDSFNMPFYMPCEEEVRDIVEREGSFAIDKLETFQTNSSESPFIGDEDSKLRTAQAMASTIRAIAEPMLTNHFGRGLVIDDLFERHKRKVAENVTLETSVGTSIIISLTKR